MKMLKIVTVAVLVGTGAVGIVGLRMHNARLEGEVAATERGSGGRTGGEPPVACEDRGSAKRGGGCGECGARGVEKRTRGARGVGAGGGQTGDGSCSGWGERAAGVTLSRSRERA